MIPRIMTNMLPSYSQTNPVTLSRIVFLKTAMGVEDVLFCVAWVLPGMVIGVVGTLLIQKFMGCCKGANHVKTVKVEEAQHVCIMPSDVYLPANGNGRVHRSPLCSNMKDFKRIPVCRKCFKIS